MKLLKIEKKEDFLYITYEEKYLMFFKKVFTDRIIDIFQYYYSTPNGREPHRRFVFCKNGRKLSKHMNDLLNALTGKLENGEIINLN